MGDPPETKPKKKRSCLVTLALLLMVTALACATLTGRLGRYWWFADLASHFAMYLTFASAGALLLTMLFRRWLLASAALAVLVVNGWVVWPVMGQGRQAVASATGPTLELAQFNILHKNRNQQEALAYLKRCNADLVFIQEIDPWWADVISNADVPYDFVVSRPGDGSFGIAMLKRREGGSGSDWAIKGTRVIDFADGFANAQRPGIEATLQLNGQEVKLLSVHPPPPVSSGYTAMRNEILRRARAWSDKQTDPNVIIGDLNTTPWSHAFAILTEDGGLSSSQQGWGNEGTWPTTRPLPMLLPIDHCLFRGPWVCVDREVGPHTGSDHLPLEVTLRLVQPDAEHADGSP